MAPTKLAPSSLHCKNVVRSRRAPSKWQPRRSLSTNVHFQTGLPTIFVYDGHAGGVGLTERGFERFAGWVADTARLLAGCPCTSGCPSCVQSPKCGNLNEPLDKHGAPTLLERMLEAR